MTATLRIVALCIAAAVLYGVLHNQVTARLCIEYFTVAHPRLVPSDDPTVHAVLWGVIATWWVGLILGLLLAAAARAGALPQRTVGSLLRPVALLLLVMWICACAAGALGWWAASRGWVFVAGPLAPRIPVEHHQGFIAALWMHLTSYGVGLLGGVVAAVSVYRSRRTAPRVDPPLPDGPVCQICGSVVPQPDLTDDQLSRLRSLSPAQKHRALREWTGWPNRWAKAWVLHDGEPRRAIEGIHWAPCPYCSARLRTPKAEQCLECGMDWHRDPPVRPGQPME